MNKIFTLITLLLLVAGSHAEGQNYYRQAGLRSGQAGGVFIQLTESTGTAEAGMLGMVSFRKNGLQATGLRVFYETSLSEVSPSLWFTWGYGGHAGFFYTDNLTLFGERYYFSGNKFCPLIGIDGWAGLEYMFETIPLTIGMNVKPMIELTFPSFVSFLPVDIGVSIAYQF
ncbi:MAG: hypothetical protein RBS37_03305 [Bacteroidales bacterium]|jgi:hypothetical protein|nr:hypothetical protein [Bacteroidales bacterium]